MTATENDEYLDIESIIERFPQFSKNQLRWIIANKKRYKIDGAIKKIGRRLYFNIPQFFKWVDGQNA